MVDADLIVLGAGAPGIEHSVALCAGGGRLRLWSRLRLACGRRTCFKSVQADELRMWLARRRRLRPRSWPVPLPAPVCPSCASAASGTQAKQVGPPSSWLRVGYGRTTSTLSKPSAGDGGTIWLRTASTPATGTRGARIPDQADVQWHVHVDGSDHGPVRADEGDQRRPCPAATGWCSRRRCGGRPASSTMRNWRCSRWRAFSRGPC